MQVYNKVQDMINRQNLQNSLAPIAGSYCFWRGFSPKFNILVTGLDCSGKTSLLHSLNTGEYKCWIPRLGLNLESAQYRNIHFTAWDIGGAYKIGHYLPLRPLLFPRAKGIIIMVDAIDRDRIVEAREELQGRILDEDERDLRKASGFLESWMQQDGIKRTEQERKILLEEKLLSTLPILIFANRQDLDVAMSVEEIEERLDAKTVMKGRKYRVQPCSLKNRTGVYEGLEWLSKQIGQSEESGQEKQLEMIEKRKDDQCQRTFW